MFLFLVVSQSQLKVYRHLVSIEIKDEFLWIYQRDKNLLVMSKTCIFAVVHSQNRWNFQVDQIIFQAQLTQAFHYLHFILRRDPAFKDSSIPYSSYQLSTAAESFLNINYNNSYKMETLKQIIERLEGDPYQILNTPSSADFAALKKNYRALALLYHPDRNKQQEATEKFIKINRAYEFLEVESNRKMYADHIKAIQDEKKRIEAMGADRRILIQNLKRRQQQKIKARQDMQAQTKRRKEYFQKKMEEEEERQILRQKISDQMTPQEYYEDLSSIIVKWQKGISFTKKMLEQSFNQYGQITKVNIETIRRKATLVLNSIQKASTLVQQFRHPLISLQLKIAGEKRTQLLNALKRRKSQFDLSLSTENITRLKEIINRKSNLYFQNLIAQ